MAYKNRMKRFKECNCKCPYCKTPFRTRDQLYNHVEKLHSEELIYDDISTAQHLFNMRSKPPTPQRRYGTCRVCGGKTDWNEHVELYNQHCGKESCRAELRKAVVKNLEKRYGKGTTTLADRPEHQIKCLRGRKISDKMKFKNVDGEICEIWYVGSYEKHFLAMLQMIGYKFEDIMDTPPATIKYKTEDGEEHYYIGDFYLPGLNLLVEISSSENTHAAMRADTYVKKEAKFKYIKKQSKFNFIQINEKRYNAFYAIVEMIQNQNFIHTSPDIPGSRREPIIYIDNE